MKKTVRDFDNGTLGVFTDSGHLDGTITRGWVGGQLKGFDSGTTFGDIL